MKIHIVLAGAFAMLLSPAAAEQSAFDRIDLGRQPPAETDPWQNINDGDLAREVLDWDEAEKRRKEREQAEQEAREETARLEREAAEEREWEIARQEAEYKRQRTKNLIQSIQNGLKGYQDYLWGKAQERSGQN